MREIMQPSSDNQASTDDSSESETEHCRIS